MTNKNITKLEEQNLFEEFKSENTNCENENLFLRTSHRDNEKYSIITKRFNDAFEGDVLVIENKNGDMNNPMNYSLNSTVERIQKYYEKAIYDLPRKNHITAYNDYENIKPEFKRALAKYLKSNEGKTVNLYGHEFKEIPSIYESIMFLRSYDYENSTEKEKEFEEYRGIKIDNNIPYLIVNTFKYGDKSEHLDEHNKINDEFRKVFGEDALVIENHHGMTDDAMTYSVDTLADGLLMNYSDVIYKHSLINDSVVDDNEFLIPELRDVLSKYLKQHEGKSVVMYGREYKEIMNPYDGAKFLDEYIKNNQ